MTPDARRFDTKDYHSTKNKDNMKTSQMQFEHGPSVLTFFMERGKYSHQTYQPKVNHRFMNFECFDFPFTDDENRKTQPLMESLLNPDEQHSFSTGEKMSIAFYEIKDTRGLTDDEMFKRDIQPIFTQNAIQVDFGSNDIFAIGRIKDRGATAVSSDAMIRCLEFFHYKWFKAPKSSNMVGPNHKVVHEDFMSLLSLLTKVDLTSHDTMRKTLVDRFHLGSKFTVRENLSMESNIAAFGDFFRAHVPLRISLYDGQHRFMLLCFVAIGVYHPVAAVTRSSYAEVGTSYQEAAEKYDTLNRNNVTRVTTALFKDQILCISTIDGGKYRASTEYLQSLGRIIQHTQKNYIAQTYDQVMYEFIQSIRSSNAMQHVSPLTYENFWGVDLRTAESKIISMNESWFDPLKRFTSERGLSTLFAGGLAWDGRVGKTNREACQVTAQNCIMSFKYFLSEKQQTKKNLSSNYGIMLTIFKFILWQECNMELLIKFFAKRTFSTPQRPIHEDDQSKFGKIDWLKKFVVANITAVATHFTNRSFVEKRIVKTVREISGSEAVQADLDAGRFDFTTSLGNLVRLPDEGGVYNDSVMATKGMVDTTRRLEYAIYTRLYDDVFRTITEHGFNVDCGRLTRTDRPGMNQLASLYLYGGKGVECEELPTFPERKKDGSIEYRKYSMELFLSVWPSYVRTVVPERGYQLKIFKDLVGNPDTLNRGNRNLCARQGISLSTGIVCKDKEELANSPGFLVPKEFLFSNFFQKTYVDVDVDIDSLSDFRNYAMDTMKDQIEVEKPKKTSPRKPPAAPKLARKAATRLVRDLCS